MEDERIERTLAGETRIDLGEILGESWRLVDGAKAVLFGGFLVFYLVLFLFMTLLALVLGGVGLVVDGGFGALILNLVATALTYPFLAGIFMVALRRTRGVPIAAGQLLGHYDRTLSLVGLNVLMSLGIALGVLLFVIPGIYLAIAWILAMPLMVDRGLGILEALETSRRLVTKHWFTVFALSLISGLLLALGVLTFGIALVWIIPWVSIAFAVLYRELAGSATFGADPDAQDRGTDAPTVKGSGPFEA